MKMQENNDMKSIENAFTIYILPAMQNNLKKEDFNSDTIHRTVKMFFCANVKMTGNRHKSIQDLNIQNSTYKSANKTYKRAKMLTGNRTACVEILELDTSIS